MPKSIKNDIAKQKKIFHGKLTRGAKRLVRFSYLENGNREYLDGTIEKIEDKEVFESGVAVKYYKTYISKDSKETYGLRKFILPDGKVFYEDVTRDINWGFGGVVYTALKDKNRKWLKDTWWTKVGGGALGDLHDFRLEDKT